MKRNYLKLTAVIIGVILLCSCGKQQKNPQANPNAPVPVALYTVTQERVTGTDVYPGTVVPVNEVELRPQVAGYITNIYIRDGQAVKQGQPLYEIDRSKYQAAHQQAQANIQSAQANLERVRTDLQRYERLLERDAIARQQVDYAKADYKTAQSQLASARAQLTAASTDLSYSVIKAPFDGTIGISQVRMGSQVSPGQTLLNTISSDNPIAVDFVINEKEIPRFNKLLQQSKDKDSIFTVFLSDGSVYPLPAKIITIDRAVNRRTGTITIRLSLPNPDRLLVAGMTVDVKVRNQDIGTQVVIPYKAVTEQMGEFFVYVAQGDSVVQRKVDPGTRFNDRVVVRSGLKEGEHIVLEGVQRLRQGAKVTTATAPPPQGSAKK